MKKIIAVIISVLLCAMLSSCQLVKRNPSGGSSDSGVFTVYIGDDGATVYSVDIKDVEVTEGALSVLNYLKDNNDLNLEYTVGAYGAFITELGSLKPEGSSYIAVYTTCETDYSLPPYDTTKSVNGVTFTYSGVGVSEMTVSGGISVLFVVETY